MKDNEVEDEFKEGIERKKERVKQKLEIRQETFDKVINKFKRSKKANYDFIVKFQNGIFKFCQEMILKEQFPESFNSTTMHMLFMNPHHRHGTVPLNCKYYILFKALNSAQ